MEKLVEKLKKNINYNIKLIEKDFVSGSTTIAINSIRLLEHACNYYPYAINFRQLELIGEKLISLKPNMSALKNLIHFTLYQIRNINLNDNKSQIFQIIFERIYAASNFCLNEAIYTFYPNETETITLLTCSYSALVHNIFLDIKRRRFKFSINLIESICNKISYGNQFANYLEKNEIKSTIYGDDDLLNAINNSNIILIGADSFYKNGDVLNGYPSLNLAITNNNTIPFYVVAESFKICGDIKLANGFDHIPNQYIYKVITDSEFY